MIFKRKPKQWSTLTRAKSLETAVKNKIILNIHFNSKIHKKSSHIGIALFIQKDIEVC